MIERISVCVCVSLCGLCKLHAGQWVSMVAVYLNKVISERKQENKTACE
jgi:hypothetical protein